MMVRETILVTLLTTKEYTLHPGLKRFPSFEGKGFFSFSCSGLPSHDFVGGEGNKGRIREGVNDRKADLILLKEHVSRFS